MQYQSILCTCERFGFTQLVGVGRYYLQVTGGSCSTSFRCIYHQHGIRRYASEPPMSLKEPADSGKGNAVGIGSQNSKFKSKKGLVKAPVVLLIQLLQTISIY